VNRQQFKQWLKRLYETSEQEISCDQFQALLPALVDFEIAGGDVQEQSAAAMLHIHQCPDCAEEYAALREVARLERQGRLSKVDESLPTFETVPEAEQGEPV
jgi:hypothetical protein